MDGKTPEGTEQTEDYRLKLSLGKRGHPIRSNYIKRIFLYFVF